MLDKLEKLDGEQAVALAAWLLACETTPMKLLAEIPDDDEAGAGGCSPRLDEVERLFGPPVRDTRRALATALDGDLLEVIDDPTSEREAKTRRPRHEVALTLVREAEADLCRSEREQAKLLNEGVEWMCEVLEEAGHVLRCHCTPPADDPADRLPPALAVDLVKLLRDEFPPQLDRDLDAVSFAYRTDWMGAFDDALGAEIDRLLSGVGIDPDPDPGGAVAGTIEADFEAEDPENIEAAVEMLDDSSTKGRFALRKAGGGGFAGTDTYDNLHAAKEARARSREDCAVVEICDSDDPNAVEGIIEVWSGDDGGHHVFETMLEASALDAHGGSPYERRAWKPVAGEVVPPKQFGNVGADSVRIC